MEVQSSSHVTLQALYSFFIYTVPQNIVICLIFYLLFRLTSKYKISVYFRKFYFIKSALIQTLIEGNVCYFCYVCLSHLSTPFSFQFGDKLSLGFTVVFFWVILMFCFLFYFLITRYLKKKAGYFLSYVYRCNHGCMILSIKNLIRNLLRAAVFYFFHEFYGTQIILLIVI